MAPYFTIDATKPSKNHSSRNGAAIRMLVIHATAGSGPSALKELRDEKPLTPQKRVSAHYLIYKTGYIYQLVPDALAAWHAGVSSWLGLNSADIMEQSIGIELENANDGHDPYPAPQLGALTWLCKILIGQYQIEPAYVVRHLDIAMPRGRKTDPAGFPWNSFKAQLYGVPPTPAQPAPAPRYCIVRGLPVYQRSDRTGPLWGYLAPGENVVIDDPRNGHLADGRGFVDVNGLQVLS